MTTGSPLPPTLDEMRSAAADLARLLPVTALVPLHDHERDDDIWLKLEVHQPINSFKIRGVYHAVSSLTAKERARGLSTVSAGNTAQALAWSARRFGVSMRSVMPEGAPKSKIGAVERYGGTPVLKPTVEVFRFLREHLWENEPYAFVHPWTERNVMIGHASLALELIEQLPDIGTAYVPVGGGGLMGGVGTALRLLRPAIKIVAVEPIGCPALYTSIERNTPSEVECTTICDGVAVPYITEAMFPILRDVVDDVALVSEQRVKATVRQLALGNRIVAEPSGALAVAAAIDRPDDPSPKVAIVTGGSIDAAKLASLLTADDVSAPD